MLEFRLHFAGRGVLNLVSLLNQLNEGFGLAYVFKIRRNHGIQRLVNQHLDVAEPLNDQRRFFIINVHDHRQRQGRLEGVLGNQADLF
ncbi:hypothetical protein SDC9_98376 [bioreactor metagenome]|uniref:Uncharacterized protein n=1 Tax=bioreactor metagenome TaxID=1076179 RepID=A0A645AF95_9ZZZZ